MDDSHYTLIVCVLLVLVAGSFLWRILCRFVTIPWPYWLAWWLENPYMKIFANPNQFVRRLDLQPGMQVLEIGCGAGRISVPVAKALGVSGKILAIDCQAGMIELITKAKDRENLAQLQILHMSSETLVTQTKFDRVLLVTVIGEVPKRQEMLKKLHMLLKPTGHLVVQEVLPDPCYQPQKQIRAIAKASGFQPQRSYSNGIAYTAIFSKK